MWNRTAAIRVTRRETIDYVGVRFRHFPVTRVGSPPLGAVTVSRNTLRVEKSESRYTARMTE